MEPVPEREAVVGILANPESGRDIRRLVANAAVFPAAEKSNMVMRVLLGLAAAGVSRAVMMPDHGGIAARVIQACDLHHRVSDRPLPELTFLDMPIQGSSQDTLEATHLMQAMGATVIVVLGGDGTHRLVAKVCGRTPMVTLSTGTNNCFPEFREATIAGLAAGLVATGAIPKDEVCRPNKALQIEIDGHSSDLALVDLCVSDELCIGARALWTPQNLKELFVTFARADAVGLSAIAGQLQPLDRRTAYGLHLMLAPPDGLLTEVLTLIAPGLLLPVAVSSIKRIYPGDTISLATKTGTIALDGEREISFGPADQPRVSLTRSGPLTIDVSAVMSGAAERGCFTKHHCPTLTTPMLREVTAPADRPRTEPNIASGGDEITSADQPTKEDVWRLN